MTEKVNRLGHAGDTPGSVVGLLDASSRPDGALSLAFSDAIVHVMLDRSGDWTITAGLSILSDRLPQLTRLLDELGFFQAAEEAGMVYHLWTSALDQNLDNQTVAEETLVKVLRSFQSSFVPHYIG